MHGYSSPERWWLDFAHEGERADALSLHPVANLLLFYHLR